MVSVEGVDGYAKALVAPRIKQKNVGASYNEEPSNLILRRSGCLQPLPDT